LSDVRVVLMSAPDAATGERIADALVRERLAACASVVPGMTSWFWWEGEVQRASEVLVLMKTAETRVDALVARAADLHPYDVPEVLALPVEAGFARYLSWVEREARA
jgi:periplasmic divalent cation tolerance protein